ncbi:class I SAM-dependent methyltransferase [Streptomyces sp. NPDC050263]|uniref:class I SAM-dependent methyltransferase n=1 Tax=Streptomyces sp. NPDC050263 TaxID=3155037 RepID=UPI00342675CE
MEEPLTESRLKKTVKSYDLRAEKYAARFKKADLSTHRQRFLNSLPNRNGWVLDVGCGAGRDCEALRREGVRVAGCDLSHGLLKIAHAQSPSTPLIQSDFRALPFEDMSFFGLWSCASLVHLSTGQAARTLAEFRRVLKPGGILFVAVRHGTGEGWEKCHEVGDRWFHLYSEAEVSNALDSSGYEILSTTAEPGMSGSMWINSHARRIQ